MLLTIYWTLILGVIRCNIMSIGQLPLPVAYRSVLKGCKGSDECCINLYSPWIKRYLERAIESDLPLPATPIIESIMATEYSPNRAAMACIDARTKGALRSSPFTQIAQGYWFLECSEDEVLEVRPDPHAFLKNTMKALCLSKVSVHRLTVEPGRTACVDSGYIDQRLKELRLHVLGTPSILNHYVGSMIIVPLANVEKRPQPDKRKLERIETTFAVTDPLLGMKYRACAHVNLGQNTQRFDFMELGHQSWSH